MPIKNPGWVHYIGLGGKQKPHRLARQDTAGRQPLRYNSLSSNIFASRVFFCTAMAENKLKQNAIA